MTEILITSSVLILALLALRKLFRTSLSRRVQYALWGLVLLRLLVPVSLPAVDFSVLTAAKPVEQWVARGIASRPVYVPVARAPLAEHPTAPDVAPEQAEIPEGGSAWLIKTEETAVQYRRLSAQTVLAGLWLAGSGAAAVFLLAVNGRFWLRLRRTRQSWPAKGCSLPVYLVETGLSSPCLFGLFRPAVYLTPAAVSSPERMRHVLAHELTHARHLDHIWTLLRGVCLAVYWFDPLVWIASAAAKTDCELACDEGALAWLEEGERIPYGQTLLALIPVRRTANPMLAATTMAAGKKQLKDRFTRIAQKPRQLAAAAVTAALLAGVVSACTFTGAVTPEVSLPEPQEDVGLQALTGEELRWFNEEFFNCADSEDASTGGMHYTIRNQFASPWFSYDRPENIDLNELFYCEGTTRLNEEELRAFLGGEMEDLPCPAYRLTAAELDSTLVRYTGLTLEQTKRIGMENFTYLAEFDAYYWMHGDTNYCGDLAFLAGTRVGSTVKLYQSDGGYWTCVTLEEQEDGSYWFVSNQACEKPAIPTPIPAGEPEVVIPLDSLEPYQAPAVTLETRTGDFEDTYENRLANWNIDGRNVVVYRGVDGVIRAAVREGDTMHVFLTGLSENTSVFFFYDLFGHDGFTVSYEVETRGAYPAPVTDYFYFDEAGTPILLLRSEDGGIMQLDLDGDGSSELISDRQMFLQRDGRLYELDGADWFNIVLEAHTPPASMESHWDQYSKCLWLHAAGEGWDAAGALYFDGEQVLFFQEAAD